MSARFLLISLFVAERSENPMSRYGSVTARLYGNPEKRVRAF